MSQDLRVHDVGRGPPSVGVDLVKDVGELQFELVLGHVPDVGRDDDVVHLQQGMRRLTERFLVEDVERRNPGTARSKRRDQPTPFDEHRAARVHESEKWASCERDPSP